MADLRQITMGDQAFDVPEEHTELTQAQYTALSEEEKNNGKVYFITDGGYYVPAVDIIPHAQQEPIIVGKFDLRGDGEYRNVYRTTKTQRQVGGTSYNNSPFHIMDMSRKKLRLVKRLA